MFSHKNQTRVNDVSSYDKYVAEPYTNTNRTNRTMNEDEDNKYTILLPLSKCYSRLRGFRMVTDDEVFLPLHLFIISNQLSVYLLNGMTYSTCTVMYDI